MLVSAYFFHFGSLFLFYLMDYFEILFNDFLDLFIIERDSAFFSAAFIYA
jgi:hypothetical protein